MVVRRGGVCVYGVGGATDSSLMGGNLWDAVCGGRDVIG